MEVAVRTKMEEDKPAQAVLVVSATAWSQAGVEQLSRALVPQNRRVLTSEHDGRVTSIPNAARML